MAAVCISRNPTTPIFSNNTISSPRITTSGRSSIRGFPLLSKVKTEDLFGMSLTLRVGAGAYGSTAPKVSAAHRKSQLFLSRSASQKASFGNSEEDVSSARDLSEGRRNETAYTTGGGLPYSSFITHLDPEIEALIARINESVVIKDMAPKSPQFVLVPRGYLVENEIKPSRFFETRGEVRDHVKKRKREGVLPRQSKKEWRSERHGFRAQEVNWTGAVHLEGCKPSNLTNDIHPIFDRSNFDDTPDSIYDQLIPGLQLATLFLTQKICMKFWVTLAMGDRRNDPEMTTRNGKLSQRIDEYVELTDERARTIIEHMNAVGKSKLIHFRFKNKLQAFTSEEYDAWGTSVPICEYKGVEKDHHGLRGDLVRSIIRIHADYYVIAKKLSQLKYQEESQKLRFNFLFAVLMIHELAHSIEGMHMKNRAEQWTDWHNSRYYKEVYWLDWQVSECGRAWEETMFGGQIAPINNRIDGSHGIAISDWPPRGTQHDPERREWNTVSMHYIEKLFQKSTWQRPFNLRDWRIFNVPRDGATSHYINSFTTMAEDEEERVAREEYAEAVALANAQPAKKKRVKATGRMEEQRPKDEKIIEEAVVEQAQQPDSPKRPTIPRTFDSKRRASSPGSLPAAQRLILLAHSRRQNSGPLAIPLPPEHPPSPPTPPGETTTPNQAKPLHQPSEIYPKHPVIQPKERTSENVKKFKKNRPKGLLAAYRQKKRRRRFARAKSGRKAENQA